LSLLFMTVGNKIFQKRYELVYVFHVLSCCYGLICFYIIIMSFS